MKNEKFTDIEWSHFSNTCAVVGERNNLYIFEHNKCNSKYLFPNQNNCISISWSYHSDILAIGASNNILILFSNKTKKSRSIQLKDIIHQNFQIAKFFWNFYTDQLCLISEDNQILILNINELNDPTVIIHQRTNFFIENSIFFNDSQIILNNKEGEIYSITKESQNYLTTILIPVLFIYSSKISKNQIITLSSDNIFTIFNLNDNFQLKKLDQKKLKDGHFTHFEELDKDKLIYSIDDTLYIMKNRLNDENAIELIIQKNDKITDFHFYKYSNTITAISEKGRIHIWSLNDEIQLIQKYEFNSIFQKNCLSTFSKALLKFNEKEKKFSVIKMPKIRYINSDFFELMQIDSHTLISNSMKFPQKVHYSIEKIRQSSNHFLIVSNSKCIIYNFSLEPIKEFTVQSNLIEFFGSRIFTINGQKIEVKNIIDNSILNSIQIESNSSIIKTALNGHFLAILTSSNEIYIFDISSFSIKPISKLNIPNLDNYEKVTSIGISTGGFCVSVTFRSTKNQCKIILISPSKSENSKEIQKVIFFNEKGHLKWDTETPNLFCIQTYENSLVTYLIDDDLKTVQLKTLSFSSELILLKVSVPRYFYSPLNSTFFSVTSKFLPSFQSLDDASNKLKKTIVLLMYYIQSKNFECALNLFQKVDDQTVVIRFLKENEEYEFLSILNNTIESEVHFSEIKHQSLKIGNLSKIFSEVRNGSKEAQNWYGRYSEFKNDKKTALSIYSKNQNLIEKVRLLCIEKKFEEAKNLVVETTDKSVICYFARFLIKMSKNLEKNDDQNFFESKEKVSLLIVDLLVKAERYGAAFEFAFQGEFFDIVEKLSTFAPMKLVYKAAKISEEKKNHELSIKLYFAAGFVSKAVEIAIKTFNIEFLANFKDKIQTINDSKLILHCAEYFEKAGNFIEAVNFFAYAKRIEKVEELCEKHQMKLSENLIDFLSSFQIEPVARLFEQQGQFLKAAQIYTNLNEYTKALKMLMKLNDIEKVVNFTENIKNPLCYSISADYIVDKFNPKRSSPLFQIVIEFYRKSENYEKIANFLKSRSKIEIETNQNYEKALELLKESQTFFAMIDSNENNFDVIENITNQIRWIEMYIEAASTKSSEVMETICKSLLNTKNALDIVRYEDIVFLQIQNFLLNEDFIGAQKLIDKLREKGVDIEKFIESDSIKRIHRAATREDPFDLSDEMPNDDEMIIEHFSDF